MRDFVDGQEQVLVRCRAKYVAEGPELPRPEGGVAEEVRNVDLEGDDAGDDVLGQGFGTAELGDLGATLLARGPSGGVYAAATCLWVRLDNGQASRPVRLLGISPEKVAIVGLDGLGGPRGWRGRAIGSSAGPLGRGLCCGCGGSHGDVCVAEKNDVESEGGTPTVQLGVHQQFQGNLLVAIQPGTLSGRGQACHKPISDHDPFPLPAVKGASFQNIGEWHVKQAPPRSILPSGMF